MTTYLIVLNSAVALQAVTVILLVRIVRNLRRDFEHNADEWAHLHGGHIQADRGLDERLDRINAILDARRVEISVIAPPSSSLNSLYVAKAFTTFAKNGNRIQIAGGSAKTPERAIRVVSDQVKALYKKPEIEVCEC